VQGSDTRSENFMAALSSWDVQNGGLLSRL